MQNSLEQIGTVHTTRNTDNHACTMISNCSFCGESHKKGKCPAFGKTCNICKMRNHLAVVCRQAKRYHANDGSSKQTIQQGEPSTNTDVNVFSLSHTRTFKNISIDERPPMKMQVDTGADISIIPRNFGKSWGNQHCGHLPKFSGIMTTPP